ncbi:MAG: PTS system mannose/fructose/sorbose family transporter subunit IID [Candidatus Methanofastidiosa archaeon]|nr:PTS system mannose/fructose/sorbose family transporter subunit IID [Candidatus Methanofastidiosa archaeon]
MTEKRLSKQQLFSSFFGYFQYCLCVFGFERLQAPGMTFAMLPIVDEFYQKNEKAKIELLKRHRVFFNTEPTFGQIIVGMVLSLEEAKANGKPITDDYIQNVKASLMGPLAGIGDSIFQGTIPPILMSIAIGLITSMNGNPLGLILYMLITYAYQFFLSYYMFKLGYDVGEDAIESVLGEKLALVQESMSVMGLAVTGAITASYVSFNLKLQYSSALTTINIQNVLDGIFPKLLSMGLVLLGYWLLSKKHFSAVKLIGLYIVIAVVGSLIGIL